MLNHQKEITEIKSKTIEFDQIAEDLIKTSKNLEPIDTSGLILDTSEYNTGYVGVTGVYNGGSSPQGPPGVPGPCGPMGPQGDTGPEPSDERLKKLINQVLDEREAKKQN